MSKAAGPVADLTGNWVDTFAPALARPYLRLARLDRPIGSWLLLIPCWWSLGLAAIHRRAGPRPSHVAAVLHRRLRDARLRLHLERHPLPRPRHTWSSAPALARSPRARSCAGGRLFLVAAGARRPCGSAAIQRLHRLRGLSALAVVAIYPFMKRITYWPQIFLGFAFSWGALMGWPAMFGRLDRPALRPLRRRRSPG